MKSAITLLQPRAAVPRSSASRLLVATTRNWRKLTFSLSRGGIRATLYWAAFGYLKRNRFWLFALDAGAYPRPAPATGTRYEIWDAARMRAWRHGREGLPVEVYQDEIDGASACSVALVGDDLAGFIWIYRQGDGSRLFRLTAAEAELNFGHVNPRYRRMGLFRGILLAAAAWLAAQGYHTVYAGVHADNRPSLKAFDGVGFRRIGTITHLGPYRPKYVTARSRRPR